MDLMWLKWTKKAPGLTLIRSSCESPAAMLPGPASTLRSFR